MSNLMTVDELLVAIGDPDVRVVDARFQLSDPAAGRQAYDVSHVKGAVYLDLDRDLSSEVRADRRGGRHPLPDMNALGERLGELGIGNRHRVVVYDDQGGMFAVRVWWLLRYAGHQAVWVLDGGFSAWQAAGGAVDSAPPQWPRASFSVSLRPEMMVDREHIRRHLGDPSVRLVDARGHDRFRGENETLDRKAGHIPGAASVPFAGNLEGGRWKSKEALGERFAALRSAEQVIVYCGSGVTANHDLLALEEAGIEGAVLYPGSWSDWVSYDDAEIETGEGNGLEESAGRQPA